QIAPEQYLPVPSEDNDSKQQEHQLLLAQLRYELAERTRLNDKYLEKLKRKEDSLRRLRGKSEEYHKINKIMSNPFSQIKISLMVSTNDPSSPETMSLVKQLSNSMIIDTLKYLAIIIYINYYLAFH
ncbi:4020_t:CDS:2, partial [Scutellospora calospora]